MHFELETAYDYNVEFETKILKQNINTIDVHVSLARTAGSSTFIISVFDTSERVQMELDLEYRATHDLLTGFFNKAFYKEQLSQTIVRAHAEDGAIAVVLMDLDRFKQVNDSFGHPAGDRLLQNVAERLLHMVGSDQLIARTGGDEFMFILEGENAAAQAESLAKKILSSASSINVTPVLMKNPEGKSSSPIMRVAAQGLQTRIFPFSWTTFIYGSNSSPVGHLTRSDMPRLAR